MKKLVSVLLVLALIFTLIPMAASAATEGGGYPLSDGTLTEVSPEDEMTSSGGTTANSALYALLEKENHRAYVVGSDDLFRPSTPMTRADTAAMICALLKEKPAPEGTAFPDVSPEAWYYEQVQTLAQLHAVNGYPDGTFGPSRNINRAEFVTILSQFAEPGGEMISPFPDVSEEYWAYEAICKAAARQWITGYPDGTFGPDNNITRAEAVTILNRVLGRVPDREVLDTADAGKKMMRFTDLDLNYWAYYEIMEAAVSHTHTVSDLGTEQWGEYIVPQASRAPGYHVIDGELYKVQENGLYLHSETDGVLEFSGSGRYTTGDPVLDQKLTNIVRTYTSQGGSQAENFRRLYRYVCDNFRYINRGILEDGDTGFENTWALQMINTRGGNCYNFASLTTLLARKMGYQAVARSGMVLLPWNYGYLHHGWCEVTVGNTVYFCDSQEEGTSGRANGYKWNLFMRRYDEIPNSRSYPHYAISGKKLN